MSGDDIVRAIETAEILAFPKASKSADDPSSAGGGGGGAPPDEPPQTPPEDSDDDESGFDPIEALNAEFSLVSLGTGMRVFREQPSKPIENRQRILTVQAFSILLANRFVKVRVRRRQEDGSYKWTTSYKKAADYWLQHKDRRTFDGVEFWPNPDGVAGVDGYLNLYRGLALAPDRTTPAGERWKRYKIFRDHLLNNVASVRTMHFAWIWAWMAHLIQRPRERIGTAIVLRGRFGVGKSTFGDVIGRLIAPHYFLVDDQRYVTGQFNTHMATCTLLQIDEGVWAGNKEIEGRLKGLITSATQMIEAKGIDAIAVKNYVRLIFTSNNEWVVPAGLDERRFAVFDVGDGVKENHGYFREMWAELENGGLEALLADLLDFDLDAPGAPNLRLVPRTEALLDQKIRSLDPINAWFLARLEDGTQTHRASGWRKRIPTVTLFNDYLRSTERIGVRRKAAETEFGRRLRKLVPGIERVKATEDIEVLEDGRMNVVRKQVWCLVFPSLAECRAAFEAQIGQPYDWGEDIDAEPAKGEEAEDEPGL
jgi:hypothetical protein